MNIDSIIKEVLTNERVAHVVGKFSLSREQMEDALPILIDMSSEIDDKNTLFLTSLKVVQGHVQRIQVRSTYQKQFAYLDNIVTQQYERINFEDKKDFIQEVGRKNIISALDKIMKNNFNGKGLYIYGGLGIGKTFILKRIAKKIAGTGRKVGFITPSVLAQKIKDSFGGHPESQSTIINLLKDVDVLCIDDIGAEAVASWFRDEILFGILNHRMHHDKLTFFSSNYSIEKLIDAQSRTSKQTFRDWDKAKRIVSRIQSLAVPIQVTGQNKRY